MPKALTRQQRKANKDQNRLRLIRFLLDHPCVDCGQADPVVLDCHHLDPETKGGDVSTLVARGLPWAVIRRELAGTISLCSNCHRKRHAAVERPWRVRVLEKLK